MINRRQVLQGIGAGAGALSVNGVLATSAGNRGFTHGVASGDPLSDRVILWSRYVPEGNVARAENIIWQVAYDRAFGDIAASMLDHQYRVITGQRRVHHADVVIRIRRRHNPPSGCGGKNSGRIHQVL